MYTTHVRNEKSMYSLDDPELFRQSSRFSISYKKYPEIAFAPRAFCSNYAMLNIRYTPCVLRLVRCFGINHELAGGVVYINENTFRYKSIKTTFKKLKETFESDRNIHPSD